MTQIFNKSIIAFIVFFFTLSTISFAETYYKFITIDNSNNYENLSDFQILVTFDSETLINEGKMKPDCSDIRFLDSDNSTMLSFWLESGCNTNETKVWVKVPQILANSTKVIYLRYDNQSDSASNPYTTFDFFDDFDGNSLNTSKWTSQSSSGGSYSVNSGKITFSTSSYSDYVWIHSQTTFNNSSWFELKILNSSEQPVFSIGYSNSTNLDDRHHAPDGYVVNWRNRTDLGTAAYSVWSPFGPVPQDFLEYTTPDTSDFPSFSLWGMSIAPEKFMLFSVNNTPYMSYFGLFSNPYSPIFSIGIASDIFSQGHGSTEVDWARVRKFTNIDPVVKIGPQVLLSSPRDYFITSPGEYNFTFYVISDRNLSCALYVDNNLASLITSVQNNTFTNISANISADGAHSWYIKCYNSEYTSYSQTRTIVITNISNWPYSDSFLIDNSNNSNSLVKYRYNFELDTQSLIDQGKMRSDCADLRFLDLDTSTFLNYWIEKGCNTPSTSIWINVPYIPANSQKIIYYYYGNLSADSASNGEQVFDFFDDFSTRDDSKWYYHLGWKVADGYANVTGLYDNTFYWWGWGHHLIPKYKSNINSSLGLALRSSAWATMEYINGDCGNVVYAVFDTQRWWNAPFFSQSPSFYRFFEHICSGSGSCPYSTNLDNYNLYNTIIFPNNQNWTFNGELIDTQTTSVFPIIDKIALDAKCKGSFDYVFIYAYPQIAPTQRQTCECNSCGDCTNKLNDPACTGVILTQNITSEETCINSPVNFSGKTFDCAGHSIVGSNSGSGIYLANSQQSSQIKNCKIFNFSTGIHLSGTTDISIQQVMLSNNSNDDILIEAGPSNVLYNVSLSGTKINAFGSNGFKASSAYPPYPQDPENYSNISKYLLISNIVKNSWTFVEVYYDDANLSSVNESTLLLAKYLEDHWELNCSDFASSCGLNEESKFVYANITDSVADVFALLGQKKISEGGGGGEGQGEIIISVVAAPEDTFELFSVAFISVVILFIIAIRKT